MMLKLTEVYRKIKLEGSQRVAWETREIYVNSENILMMKPNSKLKRILSEGTSHTFSGKVLEFTTISLKEDKEITVLGAVVEVQQIINGRKSILHG